MGVVAGHGHWIKRNVWLKIVASGCDQCVWEDGVVAGHRYWIGH